MKRENKFQSDLISELKGMFPGCLVLKNDPNYIQGIPDLSIMYNDRWAMLEVKRSEHEPRQPNQKYYIKKARQMSYASFIYPENKEEVLNELQQAFRTKR